MTKGAGEAGRSAGADAVAVGGGEGEPAGSRPRVKIWIERGGEVALSDWRVALLEAVDAAGSLSAAARQLNVPYRTAWYKLRQIETSLGVKLLETHSGGAEGGRSRLTPEARALVDAFRTFSAGIQTLVDERFETTLARLMGEKS